jgi:thiol-disulfide isomerase/thioredoxin
MRRLVPIVALLAAGLTGGLAAGARSADDVPAPAARAAPVEAISVGGTLPDDLRVTPLQRGAEKDVPLVSFGGDPAKPLVVLFWSTRCPVCRRYAPALRALAKDYESRARIALVFPNATETEADVRDWVAAQNVAAPVALDPKQAAASRLADVVTPTALVVDAAGALRYRGPIDDDRRARGRDTTDHLRIALDAVLAGKNVENAEPRAFGSVVRAAKR